MQDEVSQDQAMSPSRPSEVDSQRGPHGIIGTDWLPDRRVTICSCGWRGSVHDYGKHFKSAARPSGGVTITFPALSLRFADVWPDEDWPEHPTAEDVVAVMREHGGSAVMGEWNLTPQSIFVDGIEVR